MIVYRSITPRTTVDSMPCNIDRMLEQMLMNILNESNSSIVRHINVKKHLDLSLPLAKSNQDYPQSPLFMGTKLSGIPPKRRAFKAIAIPQAHNQRRVNNHSLAGESVRNYDGWVLR